MQILRRLGETTWAVPVGLSLAIVTALCTVLLSAESARSSEGPPAELRDVVTQLRDINASLEKATDAIRDLERAVKESGRCK